MMITQEPPHAVSTYLGLQGFRVLDVEVVREAKGAVMLVRLQDERCMHVCGECGRAHREGLYEETRPVRFRDCSLGDFPTYFEVYPWRVACCGGTRREQFPFEAPGHRMTRRFFERIAALCTRLPISEVAAMCRLSWATVAQVDKEAIALALGGQAPSLEGLRWIGVDEVSRTGGRQFFTIVTNLQEGRVVFIAEGKGDKGLRPFLEALGRQGRRRIRLTASDLGYLPLLVKALPHAEHVLDRFHIIQWVNRALQYLRRRLFGGAPTKGSGRTLKVKKWLLLIGRERLEHKNKLLLARLMHLNRPLYRAYLLKEQLRGILAHRWSYKGALRKNLRAWCRAASWSRIPEMKRVAQRLRPHLERVVAGYRKGLRMGLVEAINGKIAQLRRSARGYRDAEYFKLKIFQRCSLPNNPWAHIVL